MSALETARKAAESAQAHLRDARARAEHEAAARDSRNARARTTFWEQVRAVDLPAARQDVADTRAAFSAAVAEGGDVIGSYVAYARAHRLHTRLHNATGQGLVTYVHDRSGEPVPEGDLFGRPLYPAGLAPLHSDPEPFLSLFDQESASSTEAHALAGMAAVRARLDSVLEPGDAE